MKRSLLFLAMAVSAAAQTEPAGRTQSRVILSSYQPPAEVGGPIVYRVYIQVKTFDQTAKAFLLSGEIPLQGGFSQGFHILVERSTTDEWTTAVVEMGSRAPIAGTTVTVIRLQAAGVGLTQ